MSQRVLEDAKDRDVNESDTVMIITDMLDRVFGFDKYTEVTTERALGIQPMADSAQAQGSLKVSITPASTQ